MNKKIPEATIGRLSIYEQALAQLDSKGITTISSEALSEIVGSSAAQIRKDLSWFGEFGEPGTGYRVSFLKNAISNILGTNRVWNVGLVGVGRLGSALLAYPGFRTRGFRIVAAFDSDITKIGRKWEDIIIDDISQFAAIAKERRIEIAIIAVPSSAAQTVADNVISAGIRAILNFSSSPLSIPEKVRVRNVDLSSELASLSFFLGHVRDGN